MILDLEVLASTSIKRRKPWPRIVWVGKEKESLFLLDSGRVSVLYVPSGKTKHRIPNLSTVIEDAVYVTVTKHALFVVGLLKSGNVFLWHKDRDFLNMVTGLTSIATIKNIQEGSCRLWVSDDCTKVLVVVDSYQLYLWQMDSHESLGNPRVTALSGKWMKISVPDRVTLQNSESSETALSAVFYSSQVLGDCCQFSIVFNNNNQLRVSTLHLRFSQLHHISDDSIPSVHVEWCCNQYPMRIINSGCEPINVKGSYVTSYSPDGQVLAVAANQRRPVDTSMLFLSPLTETMLVSEMRGCGMANAANKSGRQYWVFDMSWTSDSLILACILNNGCVCLLSRLGEPLTIKISGCGMEMGPSRFVPLHPVISVQHEHQQTDLEAVEDPLRQKFSVTAHPSLPIFLFSDGYMVTVIQLPGDISCMTFMRDLVIDSSKHLNHIQEKHNLNMSLPNAYNLPSERKDHYSSARSKDSKRERHQQNKSRYTFEEAEGGLNETQDSEVSFVLESHAGFPQLENLSSGKIIFGESEMEIATCEGSFLSMAEQESVMKHLNHAKLSLLASWKLAASCSEPWTENLDRVAKHTVNNMVKLFSLILDCAEINRLVVENNTSVRVQNAGLFKVIFIYKQMLEVLQFDKFQQHLIPVALLLANKTASLILDSQGLHQQDPRLKTLNGCFTLLSFTEKLLNENYVWFSKSGSLNVYPVQFCQQDEFEPAVAKTSQRDHSKSVALTSNQLISKRLAATWSALYKNLIQFQQSQSKGEQRESQGLMCAVQEKLQITETPIPQQITNQLNPGDKHSVDGHHTLALYEWNEQLKHLTVKKNNPKVAKLMHSQLYTHLFRGDLLTAVDFVDSLILRSNVPLTVEADLLSHTASSESRLPLMTLLADSLKHLAFESPDMVPCIRDRSIRHLVQTMARFMAAYFSNKTVYIFPPHNPQPLPAIHWDIPIANKRIIPQYHEEISRIIRQNNLSGVWTVERTLEYLLLSGLACEAVWFADTMGDWKAAFLLAVACTHHKAIAPSVYSKPRKPLMLPDWLSPNSILQRKLKLLVYQGSKETQFDLRTLMQDPVIIDDTTNMSQLTATLEDIMTTAMVSRVDIVPWLLSELVESLKMTVCNFQPVVPQHFYLPSPPLYCPQPTDQNIPHTQAEEREVMLRKRAASLIQLILAVLKASHLSLPVMKWYVSALKNIQKKACNFKANIEGPCQELPEILEQFLTVQTSLHSHANTKPVQVVLQAFRDFCTIMWMIHCRDMLSLNLRKREKHLEKMSYQDYTKTDWELNEQEKWMKECFTNLQWAINLVAFSRFLPDEGSIFKIVLSLLLELPPLEDSADILAEYFYDMENLDAEVQEKLDKILFDWQTVIVKPEADGKSAKDCAEEDPNEGRKSVTFFDASPRGKSLSVYFHKQSQVVVKVVKKKRKCFGHYCEFVFDPHDSHQEDKINIGSRPFETRVSFFEFLDTFGSVCFSRQLDEEADQKQGRMHPILTPWVEEISSIRLSEFAEKHAGISDKKHSLIVLNSPRGRTDVKSPRNIIASHSKGELMKVRGLFASRSVTDVSDSCTENQAEDLSRQRRSLTKGSQQNLTELAARFSHSDEALYKQPEHPDNSHWCLNVNFGQKYSSLSKLLQWLEDWNKKHHSLGLGAKEQMFEFRPKIKIHIPAQLILLSIWLLEYKYNPNRPEPVSALMSVSPALTNPLDGRLQKKRINHFTNDLMAPLPPTSRGGQTPLKSSLQRSRSLSPSQAGRHGSPDNVSPLKGSALLEEQSVQTAYQKVLNEPDESSSLEVSSLDTEDLNGELQQTYLSVIKGTGGSKAQESLSQSMLRQRLHLSGESRQKDQDPRLFHSYSPSNKSSMSPKGSVLRETSASPERSKSRTPSPHSGRTSPHHRHKQSRSPRNITQSQQAPASSDLANQLQNIVRTEMRRIMEVQHKGLMAMMGAIDSPTGDVQSTSSAGETRVKEGDHTLHMEELRSGTMGRQNQVRGILKELKNLQQGVDEPQQARSFHSMSQSGRSVFAGNKENAHSLPLSTDALRGTPHQEREFPLHNIPKFLRIPAEKDGDNQRLHLPTVPLHAWASDERLPPSGSESSIDRMPLLRLDGGYGQNNLFYNLVPNTAEQQFPFVYPPPPPPPPPAPSLPMSSFPSHFGIPLLTIAKPAFMNVDQQTFGRLLDPEAVLAHEREILKKEIEKQRLLEEFHRKHIQEQQELEAQRFGEQLLSVNVSMRKVHEDYEETKRPPKSPQKQRSPSPKQQRQQTPEPISTEDEEHITENKSKASEEEEKKDKEHITENKSEAAEEEKKEDEKETCNEMTDEKLHDGYAIRPGAYGAYLELGKELGISDDTNAKFQYQLAMKLKQQHEKEKKKVDFENKIKELTDNTMSTGPAMEVIRKGEAATSVTKDTGSDPIQEALIEYNHTRQGTSLPPDIFLGLKFGDEENDSKETQRGRTYLNVVDISASTVLRDIAEKPSEETIQPDTTLKSSSLTLSQVRKQREDMETFEQNLRSELEPKRPSTYDSVTVKMFETRQRGREPDVSVAVIPHDARRKSKTAIVKRLCEMNYQMEAIDKMSQNIESDLQNTRMLVNTIENIGEAIEPADDEWSKAEAEKQITPGRQPSPKVSARSPRLSARAPSRMGKSAETSGDFSCMSGLSGISDIIGEIIAEGGINLEEAGLSPSEAKKFVAHAKGKTRDEKLQMSMEKLKNIVSQTEMNSDKLSPERREMINSWMEEKRMERQDAYRKQRAELREREVNPYKPQTQTILGSDALTETLKDRKQSREKQRQENMKRRFQEAEVLVGSLIVEKPELPVAFSSPSKHIQQKTSPVLSRKSPAPAWSPVLSRRTSPDRTHKILKPTIARKGPTVSARDILGRTRVIYDDVHMPRKGILKTCISPTREMDIQSHGDTLEADMTMGSNAELMDYVYAVEQMDREQMDREQPSPPESQKPTEVKPYKPKSFKELVRLQRPEVTRKVVQVKPVKITMPGPTALEKNVIESRQTTARDSTLEDKIRLYGSKHIPRASKVSDTSPRRVKSYTERLQEMKPHRQYSTPIIPRQHVPASARTPTFRSASSHRRRVGPAHKPQTYVEQLQKLNAQATRTVRGTKTVTIKPRTILKARKPLHKPKTYTEQLKSLQPPKEIYQTTKSEGRRTQMPHDRASVRSRPYSDPYRTVQEDIAEGWEVQSNISDWTVDDEVKELLYGDDNSSMYYPVASVDYQMSEEVSDYFDYVMGDDYTASVDVDEIANIADAVSVHSGSVPSVIDWDAVDQILENAD